MDILRNKLMILWLLSMSTVMMLADGATTSGLKTSFQSKLTDDRRSDNSYLNSDMNEYSSYNDGNYGYQRSRDNRYTGGSDFGRNFGTSRGTGYNQGKYGSNRDYQSGSQYPMMGNNKYGSYYSRY